MSKLMINIKRSLAIISDTHIGSRCALFPEKYITKVILLDRMKVN